MFSIIIGVCAGAGAFFMCFFSYYIGLKQGIEKAYDEGFTEGFEAGQDEGWKIGYDEGKIDGDKIGYEKAIKQTPKVEPDKKLEEINDHMQQLMDYSMESALDAIKKGR
jgi:flagellar biosynthesis/type III secretory pathway protein FliH